MVVILLLFTFIRTKKCNNVTFLYRKVTYNVHYFTLFMGSEHKVSHKYLKICDKVKVKLDKFSSNTATITEIINYCCT